MMKDNEMDSNIDKTSKSPSGEVKKPAKRSETLAKFHSISNRVSVKKKLDKTTKEPDSKPNSPENSEAEDALNTPASDDKSKDEPEATKSKEPEKDDSLDTRSTTNEDDSDKKSDDEQNEDNEGETELNNSENKESEQDEADDKSNDEQTNAEQKGSESNDEDGIEEQEDTDTNKEASSVEDVHSEGHNTADTKELDNESVSDNSDVDKVEDENKNEGDNEEASFDEKGSDSADEDATHQKSVLTKPTQDSGEVDEPSSDEPGQTRVICSYDVDDEDDSTSNEFEDDTRDLTFDDTRELEDPSRYLIKHDAFNHNSIKIDPPLYKPNNDHDGEPDFLSHKASEIKNKTVRDFNASELKSSPSARTKSLTIIETHAPAIIISNGIDYETLTVLVLHDYKDGTDLYNQISKFEDEHKSSVIHSMFSLVSHDSNLEVETLLERIAQIQKWLDTDIFTTAHLYMLDSHSFCEYYKLSKEYHEAEYLSRKKDIEQKLKSIDKNSTARLLEYKSRWWVRNIEKQPLFFDNIKFISSSVGINLTDYSSGWWLNVPSVFAAIQNDICFCVKVPPSALVKDKEVFDKMAKTVLEMSNTRVYNPAFIKSFQYIAEYLAPEVCVAQINQIALRLSEQKQLAFLSLVYMCSYAHALFYACAHRFFYHNCKRDEYDEWTSRLYSNEFSESRISLDSFRIKQAVDVDYARYLLNKPLPCFEDDALRQRMIRYSSSTSALQSDGVLEIQAKNDLLNAINSLTSIWQNDNVDFSVSAWFKLVTDEDAYNYPSDVVDMIFISVSNLHLGRSTYIFEGFSGKKLFDFARLLKKASSFYRAEINIKTQMGVTLPERIEASLKSNPDLNFNNLDNTQNNAGKCNIVVCNKFDEIEALNENTLVHGVYYILNAPKKYSPAIKSLTLKGQSLIVANPSLNIKVQAAPPTKNPDIIKKTYNHYTVVFDAMRQMSMHIYEFANQLRSELLRDEIETCAKSKAFGWWLAHQSKFLYGTPSKDLVLRREKIIENLESVPLSLGDKYALDGIKNKKWLCLPDIKTCNTDAWIAALSKHLLASLQSPQIVTLALDLITNGRHPTLLFEDGHDDLLQHVLISKQGQSLPFTLIYETRNELYSLEGMLKNKPNDQKSLDRKKQLSELLSKIEDQRDLEILSIFQQEKEMDRPLLEDAIKCFLSEAQEYYIQDVYGNRKEIEYKKTIGLLESNPQRSAFNQLLNTLMQYISEGFFPALPLSSIDTIAHHISSHGYCISSPKNRKYNLNQISGKSGKKWSLGLSPSYKACNTDIRITTYEETEYTGTVKHPTRSSVLILCNLPGSKQSLRDIKKSVYNNASTLAFASEVDCWCPTPLCEADELRFNALRDYLSEDGLQDNRYLSDNADISATHHLNTSVTWLPMSYMHRESDAIYILSLIAQKSFDSQKNHIASFNDRIDVQTKISKSKQRFVSVRLPQAAFTRREPAHKVAKKPSLESYLTENLIKDDLPVIANKILLGRSDNIHDIYYRDVYKPISSKQVLRSIAKHSISFKKDLSEMIQTHPQIDSLIKSLSDHETNPEADYFLELNKDKQEAYIYKYLIQDMGYRGIVEKINADLYNNTLTERFSANKAAIASKLMDTSYDYESIKSLCSFIQNATGYSMYSEQLQAQVLAKKIIEYKVDTVCEIDTKEATYMSVPVISCRPKPGLSTNELSKNLPAISTIFSRTFCDSSPDDLVYLGRNEWLITSGIKLPHYDQIIDLNNLVCHICTSGSDIANGSTEYLSNARHLYNTYTEKKSLNVASTHDTYQGSLSVVFKPFDEGFEVCKADNYTESVLPYSSPLTWDKCEIDFASYSSFKGMSYDQMLFGKGEYYAYCLNYPELFEFVEFNDVSGRLHKAIRMKQYAKARFSDFETLFEKVSPINRIVASDYIDRCYRTNTCSTTIFARSTKLKGEVQVKISTPTSGEGVCAILSCNHAYLLKGAYELLRQKEKYHINLSDDGCSLVIHGDCYKYILHSLGLSGFYVEGELDDLLLYVLSLKAKQLTKKTLNISNSIITNFIENNK